MSSVSPTNNGGLPQQQISSVSARQGSIQAGEANTNKQLNLISPKGGKRRKTMKYKKKRKLRGGTGSSGNSPSPISPPIVPNTGASSETRGAQQSSYNQLSELSASVNANSEYDNKKGGRMKKYNFKNHSMKKTKRMKSKTKKNKKYSKRRKYY